MASTCPSCGARYDGDLTFCAQDGARLIREAPPALPPDPAPAYIPPPASAAAPASASGSTLNGALLGILGTLAVVLVATLAFLFVRPTQGPEVVTVVPAEPRAGGVEVADGGTPIDGSLDDGLVEVVQPVERAPSVPDSRQLRDVGQAPAPAPRSSPAPQQPRRSAASFGPARVETDQTGLLLRSGPGRGYDVLGKMEPGDVVMVQGCDGNSPGRRWCEITYGGIRGYTLDEFLVIGGANSDTDSGLEQAFASSTLVNSGAYIDGSEVGYVNLRTRPFTGSDVLVRLKPRANLFVVRCLPPGWSLGGRQITGRWCFVTADQDGRSVHGWASDGALRW